MYKQLSTLERLVSIGKSPQEKTATLSLTIFDVHLIWRLLTIFSERLRVQIYFVTSGLVCLGFNQIRIMNTFINLKFNWYMYLSYTRWFSPSIVYLVLQKMYSCKTFKESEFYTYSPKLSNQSSLLFIR